MTDAPAVIGCHRYDFLASAIAGRKLWIRHNANGGATYCDGQAIVVAAQDTGWYAVAVQAALAGAGSLDAALMRQLVGRPQLTERYLYLEARRAVAACAGRLPLAFTRQAEFAAASPLPSPSPSTAAQSLALAKAGAPLPLPPAWFGTIKPLAILRSAVSADGLSALSRRQQQGNIATTEARDHGEDDRPAQSRILKLFQSPLAIRNPLSTLLNDILGAGLPQGARDRTGEAGAEVPVARIERALRRGVNAMVSRWPGQLPQFDLPGARGALFYPEWDGYLRCYRPDWVSVSEVDPWREDGVQNLGDLLQTPPREMRRQLGGLGLDHEIHRRLQEGADLDSGALIDCAIDLRTGHSPPAANIYRASRRTRRDLAVAIVVDISGSTGETDAAGLSVFHRHLQLAYRLGHALDGLGDTVAMVGFHSWGRGHARVVRLKGYEERWSGAVGQRMGLLEPLGYTRIGTAIRYGTDLLLHRIRLPNRLLILITDGIAYDQNYEHGYAKGDVRKALEEAKRAGTACICISVGSGTAVAKLAAVFGAANLLIVDEVEQITGRIRRICRDALDRVSKSASPIDLGYII